MTADGESKLLAILERLTIATERLAARHGTVPVVRERNPAVLGTATYSQEERDRQELHDILSSKLSRVG